MNVLYSAIVHQVGYLPIVLRSDCCYSPININLHVQPTKKRYFIHDSCAVQDGNCTAPLYTLLAYEFTSSSPKRVYSLAGRPERVNGKAVPLRPPGVAQRAPGI